MDNYNLLRKTIFKRQMIFEKNGETQSIMNYFNS